MRQKISIVGLIGSILLLLIHNNIIKIDIPVNPSPDVPVVVPVDPKPAPEPSPEPVPQPDNDVIVDYPEVPTGFEQISQPIYELLVNCKTKRHAFVLAETYRVWSETKVDLASKIKKTSSFVTFNNEILKDMMAENDVPRDFCPGMADAINNIVIHTLGDKPKNLTSEDNINIKNMFKAISSQSYKAYINHKGV